MHYCSIHSVEKNIYDYLAVASCDPLVLSALYLHSTVTNRTRISNAAL